MLVQGSGLRVQDLALRTDLLVAAHFPFFLSVIIVVVADFPCASSPILRVTGHTIMPCNKYAPDRSTLAGGLPDGLCAPGGGDADKGKTKVCRKTWHGLEASRHLVEVLRGSLQSFVLRPDRSSLLVWAAPRRLLHGGTL